MQTANIPEAKNNNSNDDIKELENADSKET